jgi:hypothetical protein
MNIVNSAIYVGSGARLPRRKLFAMTVLVLSGKFIATLLAGQARPEFISLQLNRFASDC